MAGQPTPGPVPAEVLEQPAWERGEEQWCSLTPCCGREIHLHRAYAIYKARTRPPGRRRVATPTLTIATSGFGEGSRAHDGGSHWEVLFDYVESCYLGPRGRQEIIQAEPTAAWWRRS